MPKEGVNVIEKGDIYFFIRPDVSTTEVKGLGEVQRFYMVLNPDSDSKFREIVVGQKKLPDIDEQERFFAYVEHVFSDADELKKELEGGEYETKTRGEREEMPARAVGEGRYVLAQHEDHSHLAYALEQPKTPNQVQKDLRIESEGSYVISVRNPDQGQQFTEEKPDYPKEIRDEFGDRKFAKQVDPKMLDFEHSEMILIGAKENPEEELGISISTEEESVSQSDLVNKLKIEKSNKRLKPIEEGKWD